MDRRAPALAKAAGREHNRDIDALGIHVPQARRQIGIRSVELAVHTRIPNVTRQKRTAAPTVRLGDKLAQISFAIQHMAVGIDDFYIG